MTCMTCFASQPPLAIGLYCCRAFASWTEFVALSNEKKAKLQQASRACFASSLQRALKTWRTHVHRQRVLRRALEGRQVSRASLPDS